MSLIKLSLFEKIGLIIDGNLLPPHILLIHFFSKYTCRDEENNSNYLNPISDHSNKPQLKIYTEKNDLFQKIKNPKYLNYF